MSIKEVGDTFEEEWGAVTKSLGNKEVPGEDHKAESRHTYKSILLSTSNEATHDALLLFTFRLPCKYLSLIVSCCVNTAGLHHQHPQDDLLLSCVNDAKVLKQTGERERCRKQLNLPLKWLLECSSDLLPSHTQISLKCRTSDSSPSVENEPIISYYCLYTASVEWRQRDAMPWSGLRPKRQ